MRNYPKLEIEEFGCHLLKTNDLDPIYVALRSAQQKGDYDYEQVARWLVAYWCFYHAGVASFISYKEGDEFWRWLRIAAENVEPAPNGGRWPRGHERRHFRAKIAIQAVDALSNRWEYPEEMVHYLSSGPAPIPFHEISRRAREHYSFGPWIGFKIADMIERVLGFPISFQQAQIFMFEDPEKAAMMLWEKREGYKYPAGTKPKREVVLTQVADYLLGVFKDIKAPPTYDRPINIQEVETILCKWKSHMNGHYPLFNDIDEINKGLESWTDQSSKLFAKHMPKRTDGL
jgi:hypothetical protein